MNEFIAKHTIDEYTDNNELNSRIYHILLALQDNSNTNLKPIIITPLTIFNHAYNWFCYVSNERHPEELVPIIKQKISNEFLAHETDVILSTLCVIASFNANNNQNIEFFLTRLKSNINPSYWELFAPILKTELELPSSFEELKSKGDKIDNLSEKELFYNDYLTRYKQAKAKGNITEQITHEIELIKRRRELATTTTTNTTEPEANNSQASIKVSTVVIMEMLKLMGHGKATNDLTKICKLIAFITGRSYEKIYNEAQKGIYLTGYHAKEITEVNKILFDLNISISIEKDKQY